MKKKSPVCHSFVNVEKAVGLIEKIVEKYFHKPIHSTRKWRVRKYAFTLIALQLLEFIGYNYKAVKMSSLDMKNIETRYRDYANAGMLFEFSRDNNRKALNYGKTKIGIHSLKYVFDFFKNGDLSDHENGFCNRRNANGVNPWRRGLEFINWKKFVEIYDEYFDELNELFGVIVEKVEDGIETVRACVSKSMKPVRGFIFSKATSTPTSPTSPLSNILKMIFNRLNPWTSLRLAA